MSGASANYISELRQKHPKLNIIAASFASEKQLDAYMFGSSGNNNLAIAPNILEKMASDPAIAAKYEHVYTEAENMAENMDERSLKKTPTQLFMQTA